MILTKGTHLHYYMTLSISKIQKCPNRTECVSFWAYYIRFLKHPCIWCGLNCFNHVIQSIFCHSLIQNMRIAFLMIKMNFLLGTCHSEIRKFLIKREYPYITQIPVLDELWWVFGILDVSLQFREICWSNFDQRYPLAILYDFIN